MDIHWYQCYRRLEIVVCQIVERECNIWGKSPDACPASTSYQSVTNLRMLVTETHQPLVGLWRRQIVKLSRRLVNVTRGVTWESLMKRQHDIDAIVVVTQNPWPSFRISGPRLVSESVSRIRWGKGPFIKLCAVWSETVIFQRRRAGCLRRLF